MLVAAVAVRVPGAEGGVESEQAAVCLASGGDAGDVAGRIDGGDTERVGGAAAEVAGAVAGGRRGADLVAVEVGAVAGDAGVVGGRIPGERQRGLADRARRQAVGVDGGVVSAVELPETGVAMSVWMAAAERAVL